MIRDNCEQMFRLCRLERTLVGLGGSAVSALAVSHAFRVLVVAGTSGEAFLWDLCK